MTHHPARAGSARITSTLRQRKALHGLITNRHFTAIFAEGASVPRKQALSISETPRGFLPARFGGWPRFLLPLASRHPIPPWRVPRRAASRWPCGWPCKLPILPAGDLVGASAPILFSAFR